MLGVDTARWAWVLGALDGAASWEEPEGRQADTVAPFCTASLHGQSGSQQVAGGLVSLSPQACWGDAGPRGTLPHCQED